MGLQNPIQVHVRDEVYKLLGEISSSSGEESNGQVDKFESHLINLVPILREWQGPNKQQESPRRVQRQTINFCWRFVVLTTLNY